jgi:hypothetical protein
VAEEKLSVVDKTIEAVTLTALEALTTSVPKELPVALKAAALVKSTKVVPSIPLSMFVLVAEV